MGGSTPKKKRHHYVPQFVLRNFSPDGRSVPTLVLETGDFHRGASVRGQCAEDYFYGREPHMEDAFAESEAKVAAILRTVAAGDRDAFAGEYRSRVFPRSTEEMDALRAQPLYAVRDYVYYQWHRTSATAEIIDERLDAEVKRRLRMDPRLAAEHPEAHAGLDRVKVALTDTMGHILYSAGPFSLAMLDMTVKFLVLEKPGLVISDHPVVLRNQHAEQNPDGPGALGLVARGLQMFMPVSPTMAIALYDGDVYDCGRPEDLVVQLSARNASVLNSMQVHNANECLYLHPDVLVAREELRRTWQSRPDRTQRFIDGPVKDRGDGRGSQFVYTLPPEVEPLPRLRCFQVCDRTTETARHQVGDLTSHPVRSVDLIEAAESMAAVLDWRVKQEVVARGQRVDPQWQAWIDSIQDPRKPGGRLHRPT